MSTAMILLFCLGCELAQPVGMVDVDVELVLAVDVSRSMDAEEFALQRAGYVEAIRHPDFIRAVEQGAVGRIAITYFEWAGDVREESLVPWQIIDGKESAEAFAAQLEGSPVRDYRGTSISRALTFATGLFARNEFDAWRKVIDVSGDGPNNIGSPVEAARDAALVDGIIINGLPILIRPSPAVPELDRYYSECVTGGPGSFVLPIKNSSEFATAIRRKLILEVGGIEPEVGVVPIQAQEPVDCLKGERDRRFYTDQFFPELDK
ncbi:MAG TPA: DUF1194 domain-containing protein [Rhizobiaceae bacterium]|nr:DUF1194 domain-containing protein [Rhizobiaceae bacterium]